MTLFRLFTDAMRAHRQFEEFAKKVGNGMTVTQLKQDHTDLSKRFRTAQRHIVTQNRIIFDALSGKAEFLFRAHGNYESEFGSMFYRMTTGEVVQVNMEAKDVTVFDNLTEARAFFATLSDRPCMVEIRAKLAEVKTA